MKSLKRPHTHVFIWLVIVALPLTKVEIISIWEKHRCKISANAQRCQVLSLWCCSALQGNIEQCRKTSADGQQCKYKHTIKCGHNGFIVHCGTTFTQSFIQHLTGLHWTHSNANAQGHGWPGHATECYEMDGLPPIHSLMKWEYKMS